MYGWHAEVRATQDRSWPWGGIDIYFRVVLFYMQYQIQTFVQKYLFLASFGLLQLVP